MKIKEGFVLRQVAGQGVVIATGEASKDFFGMVKLNTTGSEIWAGITEGLSAEQISERIAAKYDVDAEKAANDVNDMITKMKEAGFIVEE